MKSDNKDVKIPDIEIISGTDYWLLTDLSSSDVEMFSYTLLATVDWTEQPFQCVIVV